MVRSGGSPNKNMGNCVLCIWKGPEKSSNALRAFERAQAQVNSHVRPPLPQESSSGDTCQWQGPDRTAGACACASPS